jgi:radical SAM protein with 4Fe4S-binding SPASM domain
MCTAGNTTITVGSEGDVRVCSFDNKSYGNIFTEDFQDIWGRMSAWRDNSLLPSECGKCIILEGCGGGCRVKARVKGGDYCQLDPLSRGTIKEKQGMFFKEILNSLPLDSEFSCVPNLLVRKEKEGVFVVVANSMFFIVLNSSGLGILKHLSSLKSFIPRDQIKKLGLNYEFGKKFFAELYNKGFFMNSKKEVI